MSFIDFWVFFFFLSFFDVVLGAAEDQVVSENRGEFFFKFLLISLSTTCRLKWGNTVLQYV